jgi:hypothetical protein
LLCFALLCFALLCFAACALLRNALPRLLCFACFACFALLNLLCDVLHCFTLLCFALLALLSSMNAAACSRAQSQLSNLSKSDFKVTIVAYRMHVFTYKTDAGVADRISAVSIGI